MSPTNLLHHQILKDTIKMEDNDTVIWGFGDVTNRQQIHSESNTNDKRILGVTIAFPLPGIGEWVSPAI